MRSGAAPGLPAGLRIYAVGDVHGRVDLLREMRDLVAEDVAHFDQPVITVFLGDYVDRGPSSRHVLDMLVARDWPTPLMALRGNHETALATFIDFPAAWKEWKNYGALPTLASYGVDVRGVMTDTPSQDALGTAHQEFLQAIPSEHIAFLADLRDRTAAGDYFFCHAGVRPGVPLEDQSAIDLTTIREPFLSSTENFGRIVVHGHTPLETPQVRANRIGIDTGAYATGCLTSLILEGTSRAWLSTGRPERGRRTQA